VITLRLTRLAVELAVFGVPLAPGGSVLKQCEADFGSSLLFDPYTRSLFRFSGTTVKVFGLGRVSGAPILVDKILSQLDPGFAFGPSAVRKFAGDARYLQLA
jgi:hypothetical protein